jgi:hypothetical protein
LNKWETTALLKTKEESVKRMKRVETMSKTTEELEAAGYKKYVGKGFITFKNTNTLFQKRFRNEHGETTYFIDCWYYEDHDEFQCEASLYRDTTRVGVELVLSDFKNIQKVEAEIEALWYCIGGTINPHNND